MKNITFYIYGEIVGLYSPVYYIEGAAEKTYVFFDRLVVDMEKHGDLHLMLTDRLDCAIAVSDVRFTDF